LWPVIGPLIGLSINSQEAISKAEAAAQANPNSKRLAVIKWAAFFILFVPTVIVSLKHFAQDGPVRDVEKDVPQAFPVVVLAQKDNPGGYQVYLMHMYELPDFMKQHNDFTFLIPEDNAAQISARLSSKYTRDSPGYYSAYDFMTFHSMVVKQIEGGKVLIEVHTRTSASEADLAGWYEASDKQVIPKKFLYYHDMAKMIPLMLSVLLSWFVSYALGFGLLPLLLKKVWAKEPA
jgi:hypothetical protein